VVHRDQLWGGRRRLILTHMGPDVLSRLSDVEVEHAADGESIAL
jgi:hypothetical protein